METDQENILSSKSAALIISLEEDLEKFVTLKTSIASNTKIPVHKIPAVPGKTLSQIAQDALTLTANYSVGKGALGCFLSHTAAWEFIIRAELEWAIILEDDAQVINFPALVDISIPESADLIFCQDRIQPISFDGSVENPQYISIDHGVERLVKKNGRQRDIGADGYILTRRGAKKLISAIQTDKFYGHIDWRLLRYCISEDDCIRLAGDSEIGVILQKHHCQQRPSWGILTSYIHWPAIVRHAHQTSRRGAHDKWRASSI